MCGTIGGCHKCLQCHLKESHLSKASHNKKPIISTFPLCLVFLCLAGFPFLHPPFPFGRFVNHPFLGRHSPRRSTHWAFFCANPFLCIMVFYLKVLPSCIFPSLVDNIHIIGSTFIVHLAFDNFFHLASMGSWSNLANVWLGCLLVDAS